EDYHRALCPASALEQFHVDTIIRADWQRRRLQRAENKLYRALLAEGPTPEELDIAVLRDSPTAKLLRRVVAQIAGLERAFHRAPPHPPPPPPRAPPAPRGLLPPPIRSPLPPHQVSPPRFAFVPQNPPAPAARQARRESRAPPMIRVPPTTPCSRPDTP